MEGSLSPEGYSKSTHTNRFANREQLESAAGRLKIVDLVPEELTDSTPIFLASGWGETPTSHKDTLKTIFSEGRRVISVKYPRIDVHTLSYNNYPQVEVDKAVNIISALDSKGIRQVDVIAHSEGAINAIILAHLEPRMVRNIVFVDPAGLTGEDALHKLAARFSVMLAKDAARNFTDPKKLPNRLRAANEAVKYFLRNPKRGLQEAQAISEADIYGMLTDLKEMGIGVSIIHGVKDTVFPMDRLIEEARRKGKIDTIGFYSVKGDHRELSVHPEQYTRLAVNALSDLAKLPQRRQERTDQLLTAS